MAFQQPRVISSNMSDDDVATWFRTYGWNITVTTEESDAIRYHYDQPCLEGATKMALVCDLEPRVEEDGEGDHYAQCNVRWRLMGWYP